MKYTLIGVILYLSINIYSQDFYSYFDIGNMGVEFDSRNMNQVDYTHITLPTFYLRERSFKTGLSIQSCELRVPFFTTDDFYFTFLDTTIFWSPFDMEEYSIFGPFFELNFIPNSSYWVWGRGGIKFMWVNSYIDNFVLRNVDIEIGYTINESEFYISLSTDFTMIKEGLTHLDTQAIDDFLSR